MTVIFDGKAYASQKEEDLKLRNQELRKKGIIPRLASIIVGDDPSSVLYVNLKKKAAERVGCELLVVSCEQSVKIQEVINKIKKYNTDKSVHGIMVQLPLPEKFSIENREEILNSIDPKKDVDGLSENSPYLTPTVKAVLAVLTEAKSIIVRLAFKDRSHKLDNKVIIGANGFEGKKILKALKGLKFKTEGLDRKTKNLRQKSGSADILISVTGSPGIIGKDDIKDGAVVIDVGSPKGDVKTDEVINKAAFLSPVPGGVGPVTIVCLLENLIGSASNKT